MKVDSGSNPVRYTNVNPPQDNGCDNCAILRNQRLHCPAHRNRKTQYTGGGNFGFRLFDVAHTPQDALTWPRERIASWREHGGQSFATEDELVEIGRRTTGSFTTCRRRTWPSTPGAHSLRTEQINAVFRHAIRMTGTRGTKQEAIDELNNELKDLWKGRND